MSLKFLCPVSLIVLGACAAPQSRTTGPIPTIRSESGALSEEAFLNAPWRSSNIQQTAMEDGQVKLFVQANRVTDKGVEPDQEMTEYLETELNALQRFPVESFTAGFAVANNASEIGEFGMADVKEGTNAEIGYLLEWKLKKKSEVRTPSSYPPIGATMHHLHEYWYEGPVNLWQIGGAGRKAVWADRTFRSRSAWKLEKMKVEGEGAARRIVHGGLHDPSSKKQEDMAYDEAASSLVFNFSKEVYSKLGRIAPVENAIKSGADVLISTPLGSNQGVVQGQPMFVAYKMGNLEVFLGKAIVDNPSAEGSTLRVIQWKPGEALAEEFAAEPTSFISRNLSAIVARTEGLALPEAWSERSAALEFLLQKYEDDAKAFLVVNISKKDRETVLGLIRGQ